MGRVKRRALDERGGCAHEHGRRRLFGTGCVLGGQEGMAQNGKAKELVDE